MTCYLLHFDRPLGNPANPRGQARHYIGWVRGRGKDDQAVKARLEAHQSGRGRTAAITRAAVRAGIVMTLVHVWPGASKEDERRLKRAARAASWCPICRPGYLAAARERVRARRCAFTSPGG